jgi:hypothetical protein
MRIRVCYHEKDIKATFCELNIGETITEPVRVTLRLEKSEEFFEYKFLRNVVCFYDVCTQNVWMDGQDASWLMNNYEIEDSLCAYVKEKLDVVFSATEESAKHLVEILCQEENMLLGDSVSPFRTTYYSLYYQEGVYELQIPIFGGGGVARDKQNELLRRTKDSVLPCRLAFSLNWIVLKDASFLNQKFMVKREPGKRNGTKVVRECQKKVQKILVKAEEYCAIIKSYRDSM